ncbi:MAG TPA: hypothetical protein VF896_00665 [Anaerolineales bacterium]
MNFTSRLGDPFGGIVSVWLSPWWSQTTTSLLSVSSFSAYLFSSQLFPAARDDIDFR